MSWWNPFSWFSPPVDETWDDAEAVYDALNPVSPIVPYFDPILMEFRAKDAGGSGGVTETRVQELIDASIGDAVTALLDEVPDA